MNPLYDSARRLYSQVNDNGFTGKSFGRWRNNQPILTRNGIINYNAGLINHTGKSSKQIDVYNLKLGLPQTDDHYFIQESNAFNFTDRYNYHPSGKGFRANGELFSGQGDGDE